MTYFPLPTNKIQRTFKCADKSLLANANPCFIPFCGIKIRIYESLIVNRLFCNQIRDNSEQILIEHV